MSTPERVTQTQITSSPADDSGGDHSALPRQIIDGALSAFIAIDATGVITDWNRRAESIFGWSRAEILGHRLADTLIPPQYREAHHRGLQHFLKTGEGPVLGRIVELSALRRTGEEFPIELAISALPVGDSFLFYAFAQDITERKRAEALLQERESLLHSLFESAPDALVLVDREGDIVHVNSQVESFFDYRREELIGRPVEHLIPERFRTGHLGHRDRYVDEPHRRAMGSGMELYGRRRDGSEFPVDIMLSPVETARGKSFLAAVRDVTERKRAEEALRASEERFRLMVQEVKGYAIIMLDPVGMVQTWNVGAERLTGYPSGEILGRHFSCFYAPEEIAEGKPQRGLRASVSEGRFDDEGWRVRKDGTRFLADVVITPVYDAQRNLRGHTKITRDVTERLEAEQAIREARNKQLLLREVQHRLKNNLQVIASMLRLEAGAITDARMRRVLHNSLGRVRSLALIHERLYAAAEPGTLDFDQYLTDLMKYLTHSFDTRLHHIEVEAEARGISLRVETAVPCGLLITELVSNAFKHAFPAGGPGRVRVELTPRNHHFRLTVADDGIGLPPGFNLHDNSSIGLQLVTTMAEQLDAAIAVEVSQGTRFTIEFAEGAH